MKTRTFCLAAATGLLCLLPMQASHAGTAFSVGISISNVNDFYEPMGAYGTWMEVGDYGRCWRPAYIGSDWRPYGVGHWVSTDSGWYWESDEPWAWATYHYGRWVYDPYYGWLWVPDTVWGPSWVSWRGDGMYCGWAPLPPRRFCGRDGLVTWEHIGWASRAFVFVEFGRFCEPIRHDHHHRPMVVNQTIINKTVNITNVRVENNRTVVHNGPDAAVIRQHVGDRLQTGKAEELWRDRSDRVSQRASLERAPAPPMVKRADVGAAPTVKTTAVPVGPAAGAAVRQERREERRVVPTETPRRDVEIARPTAPEKEVVVPARPTVEAPVRQERKEDRREIPIVRPTPSVPVIEAERREPQWKQRMQPSNEQPVVAPRSAPVPSRSQEPVRTAPQEQRWQKPSSAPSQENRPSSQEQRQVVPREQPGSNVQTSPGAKENRGQRGQYGSTTDDPSQRRMAYENRGGWKR